MEAEYLIRLERDVVGAAISTLPLKTRCSIWILVVTAGSRCVKENVHSNTLIFWKEKQKGRREPYQEVKGKQ